MNGFEIPIANFTVKAGENRLQRPVAGGVVQSGSLKFGRTVQSNLTYDTGNKTWFKS
jgi:alkaline phosphatase D